MVARLGTLLIATFIIMLAGTRLGSAPAQQLTPVADGAHIHPRYETEIAALWQENAELRGTVSAHLQVLPSPSPHTFTPSPPPTWTATPGASITPSRTATRTPTSTPMTMPLAPTAEIAGTPSQVFSTATRTPTTGAPNMFDPDYTCRMLIASTLTKRQTPSTSALSLGTVPAGTEVLIYPYHGSIPYSTSQSWWYVEVHESQGGGWLAFARVAPPSEATPGNAPIKLDTFMQPVDQPCIPVLLGS